MEEAVPEGSMLVTGGIRMRGSLGDTDFAYWNSLYVINDRGEVANSYDKSILVPFGEFVPFKRLLSFMDKITEGLADFDAGDGGRTLDLDGLSMAIVPLICYESAFSRYVRSAISMQDRAVLVNITNDAWFGDSIGPYQHYYMAKFRAVENNLPLIRAANTGISGSFDRLGREGERGELNQLANLDIILRF